MRKVEFIYDACQQEKTSIFHILDPEAYMS
jgi:hypothetical protein